MASAKKVNNTDAYELAKMLRNRKQAALRKLIDDHSFLYRDYFREKIL